MVARIPAPIWLWEYERKHLIDNVEFYNSQLVKRVFRPFDNFDTDVDEHVESLDEIISERVTYDDYEAYVEAQLDAAQDFSERLYDVSREMFLAALSAMYFFWDRQVRTFLHREFKREFIFKENDMWRPALGKILKDTFSNFDESDDFIDYNFIEDIHLKVNIYKHGRGQSLDLLQRKKGVKAEGFLKLIEPGWFDENTIVTDEEEFVRLVEMIKLFWNNFPEYCHHTNRKGG